MCMLLNVHTMGVQSPSDRRGLQRRRAIRETWMRALGAEALACFVLSKYAPKLSEDSTHLDVMTLDRSVSSRSETFCACSICERPVDKMLNLVVQVDYNALSVQSVSRQGLLIFGKNLSGRLKICSYEYVPPKD